MKEKNLCEGSESYHEKSEIYERFSQVEDTPGKILDFLKIITKKKIVLDLGCGTGKYLAPLYKLSKKYIGLDISQEQINIAKRKVKNEKVKFICSTAENINLADESVDVIISTWVLGTILDRDRRLKTLQEAERVLKKNGKIYLVENNVGGEFEKIRKRFPDLTTTQKYNKWITNQGFKEEKQFDTYFEFESEEEGNKIFSAIWGEEIGNNVKDKRIEHKVIIYSRIK